MDKRRSRKEVLQRVWKKAPPVRVNASTRLFYALMPDKASAIKALTAHFKQQVRSHYLHKKIDEFIDLAKWVNYDQPLPNGSNPVSRAELRRKERTEAMRPGPGARLWSPQPRSNASACDCHSSRSTRPLKRLPRTSSSIRVISFASHSTIC